MPNRRRCTNACALVVVLLSTGYSAGDSRTTPSFGYQLPLSFPVGTTARLVAHADLNGDGKEDLIFAGQSAHERQRGVEILEGNGDGTFREGVTIELQSPTRAIAVADVNGDGKPDLILLHPGVAVLLNTTPYPGAAVSFGTEQGLMGGFGPALAAADLNGDGKAEVLVGTTPTKDANDETGTLRIATAPAFIDANHHAGAAPLVEIPIPGVPVSIAIADFDGDGKPDVAVGFRGPGQERRGGVLVLLNRTESASTPIRFADPIVVQFDHVVNFVAAGDLNGDGRNDIFAAWCSGAEPCGAVSLLNRPGADGGISFANQNVPLGVERARNWILQDVNHDGRPDLLFLNRLSGVAIHYGVPAEIVVALGVGNGKFASPRTFSAPTSNSLDMILADFNRDGQPDLAVLDAAWAPGGRVGVLLGRNDGGFHAPEALITGFAPTAAIPFSEHGRTAGFVVTDIPQNGIASSSSKANHTAEVFAGKSLDPPYTPLYMVRGVPDGAIAVGDLNGDGRSEMVVATASGIQVYDLQSTGRNHPIQVAKFQAAGNRFGAVVPQRAILQDVNGDGKPDLIVGNGYDRSLQVYINTGANAYSFANPVQVPWCPKSVPPLIMKGFVSLSLELATADINGDGKPDLVVNGYCGINVLLNHTAQHGAVTFDAPVQVLNTNGQPLHAQDVAMADVNRDGKVDLIVAENNYGVNGGDSSTLDVLLNETTSSPSFRLAQQLAVGKRVTSVVAADFNQAGWPDLAVVDAVDGTLSFLFNDGQWKSKGAFAIHSSFTVMPGSLQLLMIDRAEGGLPKLLLRSNEVAAIIE